MSKLVFYDWFGYNSKLFHDIHHLVDNHTTIKILKLLSDYVGNYLMLPIHLVLLAAMLLLLTKICNKPKNTVLIYIKTILVLCASMVVTLSIGYILKISLEYSRPYCTDGTVLNEMVKILTKYKHGSCYHSAPSGHSIYTTTFVFSIWPILNKYGKLVATTILAIVMASRVLLGFHFPADVFYGFTTAAILTLLVKKYTDITFSKIAEKIYSRMTIHN